MKKILLFTILIIICAILIVFFAPLCGAADIADTNDIPITGDAAALEGIVPDEARDGLDRFGISTEDPTAITRLSPSAVFSAMLENVRNKLLGPLRLFFSIFALSIMFSLMGKFPGSSLITSAAGAYIISGPISNCLSLCGVVLSSGAAFMQGFVPIFAGICALSGSLTASASYNVIVLLAAQGTAVVSDVILLPLIGMSAALSIIGGMNPIIDISPLLLTIKKAAIWILGALMAIFTGLLTIQTVVGSAADTLALRTGKFLVSSLIPVVGNAVSEAYSTMSMSMSLLKSGTGVFGIAVLLSCVVPVIISVCLYCLSISFGGAAAELFGAKELGLLCRNMVSVLEIMLAVLISFLMLMIISTAILMTIRN